MTLQLQQRRRRTMQAGSFLLLLSLQLLSLLQSQRVSAAPVADIYTDPEYTFRIDAGVDPLPSLAWTLSTVSSVDDGPYEVESLPFAFPFWGQSFSSLAVSPNGALHLPPPPLNGTCVLVDGFGRISYTFSAGNQCDLNSNYAALIAVSLTDQNPSASLPIVNPQGVYFATAPSEDAFYARWTDVKLYIYPQYHLASSIPSSSFSVELRPTGRVTMRYNTVSDPRWEQGWTVPLLGAPLVERAWLVGLRAAPGAAVPTRFRSEWNTTVGGSYPPRSAVRSSRTITFYPFGSVACNEPTDGDGVNSYTTRIYLNDASHAAAGFDLVCVYDSGARPSAAAYYNSTLHAVECALPRNLAPGTKVLIQLAEASAPTDIIPLTPLYFTYWPVGDPVLARYDGLSAYTGGEGGADMRVCYQCARMRPELCAVPRVTGMCNTPQLGSDSGDTSTVILAEGYSWPARLESGAAVKNIWCVWSEPSTAGPPSASIRARSPHGLNPYLNSVTWVPARLYANATGWIVCDPPPSAMGAAPGTTFNLSLAENNFVWAGAMGPVGAGVGGPSSPLGEDDDNLSPEAATVARREKEQEGNKHVLLSYTIAAASDPRILAYEAEDYLSSYLLNSTRNLTADVGAQSGLNLLQLCGDCSSRLGNMLLASTSAQATDASWTPGTWGRGFCLDPRALGMELCISPSLGDARGTLVAGKGNASFHTFVSHYPAQERRRRFLLSCALHPYEKTNYTSTKYNVSVPTAEQHPVTTTECNPPGSNTNCANVTRMVNLTVVEERTNISYSMRPIGEPLFVPLEFEPRGTMFSCATPALDVFGLNTLQASHPERNISTDSVLVLLAENNRILDGVVRAGSGAEYVVYRFVDANNAELQQFIEGRSRAPPLPPWSSCFSCDFVFRAGNTVAPSLLALENNHCFHASNPASLGQTSWCISPNVGSMDSSPAVTAALVAEAGASAASNRSIQVYAGPAYPIADRAALTQLFCVFSLPTAWNTTLNASTNATSSTMLPDAPLFFSPVLGWDAVWHFVLCDPPSYGSSLFGSARNLTVRLSEYGNMLPLAPLQYLFVEEDDEELMLWKATRVAEASALSGGGGSSSGSITEITGEFSAPRFCSSCHASAVSVPGFTPGSPRSQSGLCFLDCAQRWNGGALYDDCGICVSGPNDPVLPSDDAMEPVRKKFNADLDCLSTCFGPFRLENVSFVSGGLAGQTVETCLCRGRAECFNISAQPLVGVSISPPPVPGQPQQSPLNEASVASQQYLLRSIPLSRDDDEGAGPNRVSPFNDLSSSHTADPDFSSSLWEPLPANVWQQSPSFGGLTDPYPISVGFSFPFFESSYQTVYLSSSGAIHFAPVSSLPPVCRTLPLGTDPRVKSSGLLSGLWSDASATPSSFGAGCASRSMLLPYFTFLDPTSNISLASASGPNGEGLRSPSNASVPSISFQRGDSSQSADPLARAGKFLSIRFENVPYSAAAFGSNAGRDPPLYSFQVTLYQTGRVSIKHHVVTDPLGPSGTAGAGKFNTSSFLSRLAVGLIDRPLPASVLTQSAPSATFLSQVVRERGESFDVQGSIALGRQRDWLNYSSALPIGVFPPRRLVHSAMQHIFCPFALNACAYPGRGPASGGTVVSISLFNLSVDKGCIERLLRISCLFGSAAPPTPARFQRESNTLECLSPPGLAQSTVPLLLVEGNTTMVTSNKLFWSWFTEGDPRLLESDYDESDVGSITTTTPRGNLTRLTRIAGLLDSSFPAGVNGTQSLSARRMHLCESCANFNPGYCQVDCAGEFFGTAFVDECGNCTSGSTGKQPGGEKDCAGVCGGLSVLRGVNVSSGVGAAQEQLQCICAPESNRLCAAGSLPMLRPPPSQSLQYVYHLSSPLSPSEVTNSPLDAPVWDESLQPPWTQSFTSSAETPLPHFHAVELDFTFPFYARSLRNVFVSGWGGVFLEDIPSESAREQCLQNGVEAMFRNNGSSLCPFDILAASVANYVLDSSAESTMAIYSSVPTQSIRSLTVIWKDMRVRGNESFPTSFALQLAEDGRIVVTYRKAQDPNPEARAAARAQQGTGSFTPAPFVPTSEQLVPPAPGYASSEPFWLAGVAQSWYTTPGIFFSSSSDSLVARDPSTGEALLLSREVVSSFPAVVRTPGALVSPPREQLQYLALSSNSSSALGTFPDRLELGSSLARAREGESTRLLYCPLSLDLCASISWGPIEGGTLVRFFGQEWGCRTVVDGSTGMLRNQCCASELRFECVFGGVSVPALFKPELSALECLSPPGAARGASVEMHVAESGRRVGTSPGQHVFVYNTTRAELADLEARALAAAAAGNTTAGSDIWTYNSNAAGCSRCASFMPSWMLSTSGLSSSSATDSSSSSSSSSAAGFCSVDCAGRFNGTARRDSCGVCTGGFTGIASETSRDCRGICFGPFRWKVAPVDESAYIGDSDEADMARSLRSLGPPVDPRGFCVCDDSLSARTGGPPGSTGGGPTSAPSCDYYSANDGPVQASTVIARLGGYETFLITLAAATIVAGGAWHASAYMKRRRQVGGMAGVGPEVVVAQIGAAPAAGGAAGAAMLPLAPPPPPPAPRLADELMGAAGGLERLRVPARAPVAPAAGSAAASRAAPTRAERQAAERAAAAAPRMSAAAALALGDDDDDEEDDGGAAARRHRNPPPAAATHYTFSANNAER